MLEAAFGETPELLPSHYAPGLARMAITTSFFLTGKPSTAFYPNNYPFLAKRERKLHKDAAATMDLQEFVEHVPNLTDLELAVLLSLIANQHCLVYTDDDLLDPLASELALIVSETFRLSYVVLGAEELHSLDKFGDAILDDHHNFASESDHGSDNAVAGVKSRIHNVSFKDSRSSHIEPALDSRMVVNVVIAKDFNHACHDVQIQVMELMLKRRIFSRTAVHPVPKTFLFLPIVTESSKHVRLNHHLVWTSEA